MGKRNASFMRQTAVLTARYFHIFWNNKKNLLMVMMIPVLTMIIVALVACVDMYVDKDEGHKELNAGYPVLSWEIERDEKPAKWDGKASMQPQMFTMKIDDEDYYVINDISDFVAVISQGGEWLKKNYCLNHDMNLDNHEWTPIGKGKEEPFQGKFDGRGYIISNLKLLDNEKYTGFFGYTKNAEIKNVGFEKVKIDSKDEYVGTLAGYSQKTKITECFARKVELKSEKKKAGIMVGEMDHSKINTCYAIGTRKQGKSKKNCGLFGKNVKSSCEYYYEKINGKVKAFDKDDIDITDAKLKEQASILGKDGIGFRVDRAIAEKSATQIGLFMIICVAIFVGICNSIQEIIKERNILKREYMSNLRLGSYVVSKLIVQGCLCLIQTLLITVIFYLSIMGRSYPVHGIVMHFAVIDFYVTVFLVTFASDVTALFISSIVKSSVMANTFIPIILIVQIIFSGVLFELGKAGDIFASLMLSKWGVAALSALSRLNESRPELLLSNPEYEQSLAEDLLKITDINASNIQNMLMIWGILIAFIIVFALLSRVSLIRVKNDKR